MSKEHWDDEDQQWHWGLIEWESGGIDEVSTKNLKLYRKAIKKELRKRLFTAHERQWLRRGLPACTKCKTGRVRYAGEDFIGSVWINVYECDECEEKFV
jgi:hypothetical protein